MNQIKLNMVDGIFVGVLSGTSMDHIDAVLVEFYADQIKIIDKISSAFPQDVADQLLKIIKSKNIDLRVFSQLDKRLGIEFGLVINKLLNQAKIHSNQIIAIGSHGQNIWHEPTGMYPNSIQIGDPNVISVISKITTIADFRRKDLALGGQGAPLAPGFHAAIFRSNHKTRAIINIGGICNISILPKDPRSDIIGFDLGPGNCLMDELVQSFKELNLRYDQDGILASKGTVIDHLLELLLQDPYCLKPYPKSIGREYFNLNWLRDKLAQAIDHEIYNVALDLSISGLVNIFGLNHLLATLLDFTCRLIQQQILYFNSLHPQQMIEEVYICGGGARNIALMQILTKLLDLKVATTDELGIAPEWVEAGLFAWLARQTINRRSGNLSSVTGAKQSTILGGIYYPH